MSVYTYTALWDFFQAKLVCILFSFSLTGGYRKQNILHQKGLRTLYNLIFHSEATITLISTFHFYFMSGSNNFSVLGMKTRPWKCFDLAHNMPYYLPSALFEHTILRRTRHISACTWASFLAYAAVNIRLLTWWNLSCLLLIQFTATL